MRANARSGDREQLDPHRLRKHRLLDLAPQFVEVEKPLGDQEGRNDLLERGALLFHQVEGHARTEPVDEAVGDLGGDDLVAQAMRTDRIGMRSCASASGTRRTAAARRRGSSVMSKFLRRSLQHHLRDRQDDRKLGPSQAAILLRAPHQLLARRKPFDLAVEAARGFEQLDRPDMRRKAVAPPASAIDSASDCSRLSSSTISATSSVIFASRLLRFSNDSGPSRISRFSGILMFTSLSEQSTPALLSMKSVLMRPPCSANSIRPGLGDGEVGALADHLRSKLGARRRGARRWTGRRRPTWLCFDALM